MSRSNLHENFEVGIIHQLNELFGNVVNLDTIKTVAVSCNYDVLESSHKLLEMSDNTDTKKFNENIGMNEWKYCSSSRAHLSNAASYAGLPLKKTKKCMDFDTAIEHINAGFKVLILLRGLPGSGKSHLAKEILQKTIGLGADFRQHILSTDDFFYQNARRVYEYDVTKINEAHNWNQRNAFEAMRRGFSPVIIDNTNTQMWEMKPYATMAIDYGYILEILEPDTHWCFNDKELTKRNVHGVPKNKIRDMIERYEKNITPQKLLSAYNLFYKFQKPPQYRLYPPVGVNASKENTKFGGGNFVKSTSLSVLNHSNNIQSAETINLMNFDDDDDDKDIITKSIPHKTLIHDNTMVLTDDEDFSDLQKTTRVKENDLFSNLELAWGVDKNTFQSWDMVTPINDPFKDCNPVIPVSASTNKNDHIQTTDSECITEDDYFKLVRNKELVPCQYNGLTVLETFNRDINYGTPKKEPNSIVLKCKLDKSCMTDDVYDDYEDHMYQLESLFPGVPRTHLNYWYTKCKGDLEWTIEFLLEAKDDVQSLIETDDTDNDDSEKVKLNTSKKDSENKPIQASKKKRKKINNNSTSSLEDREELKRIFESKIDIGGEHYSKQLLKVKNYKIKSNEPSTSKNTTVDEIISVDSEDSDSDSEFNNLDEDTVELNLGEHFVNQLEERFADPNIQYPKGFQPVVQLPVTLAKQLYSFYIESIYQQMENQQTVLESLIREDEEFAKRLQANEETLNQTNNETNMNQTTPSLKEIQHDQQAAKKAYEKEMETWKCINPDTLAHKLTKQKLFSIFPSISQDTLIEILHAHDNKYVDTVETLMASTQSESVHGSNEMIMEPPIKDEVLEEMKTAQKENAHGESQEPQEARFYREEANKYLNKRADLYQKAKQYHQRGMKEVAQFYSGLACLQTTYFDRANNLAATAFLDEHSQRLQDFNTLDLHFLYVKEALPALDVFLDRNINLLKLSTTKNNEHLQIITGRGNRSENGKSKIKPAVMNHLRKRKIKFTILNPGLLKVKINKKSLVTSEFLTS